MSGSERAIPALTFHSGMVVAEYSAHVPVPIVFTLPDGQTEKTLADGSALWRKPRAS